MSRFDPEMMEHVRERVERLRDYTPAEEFDETTALGIAKREVEPLYGDTDTMAGEQANSHHPNAN